MERSGTRSSNERSMEDVRAVSNVFTVIYSGVAGRMGRCVRSNDWKCSWFTLFSLRHTMVF